LKSHWVRCTWYCRQFSLVKPSTNDVFNTQRNSMEQLAKERCGERLSADDNIPKIE
jgi:hypothetical protein